MVRTPLSFEEMGVAINVLQRLTGTPWWRLVVVVSAMAIATTCAPTRPEHDLKVTNAWVMDLTIQISVAPLAPRDQRSTLGQVRVGQTRVFTHALPEQDRYAIHARYNENRLEFDTVCLSRQALEQLDWAVTIPGTSGVCE